MAVKRRPSLSRYAKRAVELGAESAKVIPAATVVTAAWVRFKCQYGCGGYGGCLTCPPYSPTPDDTAEIVACYRKAILVRNKPDSGVRTTGIVSALEREIFLDGYHKALAMGAGPCSLCKECDWDTESCRHPYEARPSMEACGIDVFQTARNNGYPIKTVRDHDCDQDYYGIVFVE